MDSRLFFDRRHGPAPGAAGDGLEGTYSAVLQTAPANGSCTVVIPALGLTFPREAKCSAAFAGAPGDEALIAFDEQKRAWIVSS